MIYTKVTTVLDRLIKYAPSPKETIEALTDGELAKAVSIACLSAGGIKVSNIARITKIEDKHIHCILCELNEESVDKFIEVLSKDGDLTDDQKAEARGLFLSVCTVKYGDECYTVLFTGGLYNGEFALITKVYELLTTEYMHSISTFGLIDEMSEIDNYVERAYNLSCFYIPAMLTPYDKLPEHVKNYEPLKQFVRYVKEHCKNTLWYTSLFDYNEITTVGDCLGYEQILFDEEDIENDEDITTCDIS